MTNKQLLAIAAATFVCGVLTLLLFLNYQPSSQQREALPILGDTPAFALTDSRGQTIRSEDLRGRIWVADFFFTDCPGPCPAMSKQMARIHSFFADEYVRQVSFSVQPEQDQPEVLAQYAKKFKADPSRWHFLTGDPEVIHEIAHAGFKMGDPDSLINHSTKFALVDRSGFIRGYYEGTEPEAVDELMEDLVYLYQATFEEAQN